MKASLSQRPDALFAITLFSAVVLIPVITNGFPFVFTDTGVYLRAAVEGFFPWERSVYYSIFAFIFHLRLSPWPIVVAQAFIMAILIRIFAAKIFSVRSEAALIVTALLLSFASSLPWFVGELTPDIFTGALILSSLIVVMAWDGLANWERAFTLVVVGLGVIAHSGNVLIACASLPMFGILWVLGWHPTHKVGAGLLALTIPISLGTFLIVSVNALTLGRPVISASSSTFMLAKLLHDGPAFTVLERNCPASGWALCAELEDLESYRNRQARETWLPSVTEHFLWGGPLGRLGWWKAVEPEAAMIVRQALFVAPLTLMEQSSKDTLSQLTRFSVGDALRPYGDRGEPVDSIRTVFGETTVGAYLASSQARSELPLKAVNVLQKVFVIVAFCLLVGGGIYMRQRDPTVLRATLALCGFLFVNAAVMATFSSVNDRYQSRVIWLVPMLASLTIARWLTRPAST